MPLFCPCVCSSFIFILPSDCNYLFSSPPEDEDALFYPILARRTPWRGTKIGREDCKWLFVSCYGVLQHNCKFKERHEKLVGKLATSGPQKKNRELRSQLHTLLHELDSSDDDELSNNALGTSAAFVDAIPTWLRDFNTYLNTTDEIPTGQTIVQWWGVSSPQTLYFLLVLTAHRTDQHSLIYCMGITCKGLSCNHGIIRV